MCAWSAPPQTGEEVGRWEGGGEEVGGGEKLGGVGGGEGWEGGGEQVGRGGEKGGAGGEGWKERHCREGRVLEGDSVERERCLDGRMLGGMVCYNNHLVGELDIINSATI